MKYSSSLAKVTYKIIIIIFKHAKPKQSRELHFTVLLLDMIDNLLYLTLRLKAKKSLPSDLIKVVVGNLWV